MKSVDLQKAIFSDVDDRLLATVYYDDKQRIVLEGQRLRSAITGFSKVSFRVVRLRFASHTADESKWIIDAHSDIEPGEVYLFDRKAKQLTLQYRVREEIPRASAGRAKANTLQIVRWFGDSGLSHSPKGSAGKGSSLGRVSPWRAMGARRVGLQHVRHSSSPIADMQCCSRISEDQRVSARSS